MSDFVATIVDDVATSSVAFLEAGITGYWTVILSVLFVGFMISLFWWLARKLFGHRQY